MITNTQDSQKSDNGLPLGRAYREVRDMGEMGIDFLLYTLGYGIFLFLWITYSKTFFMQPKNKINNPTQFMRIVFEFESFEYLRYNDFNSVS